MITYNAPDVLGGPGPARHGRNALRFGRGAGMISQGTTFPAVPRSLVPCCQSSPLSGRAATACGHRACADHQTHAGPLPMSRRGGTWTPKNSRDVIDLLYQASRRYRQTVLMITHNVHLTSSVDWVLARHGRDTLRFGRGCRNDIQEQRSPPRPRSLVPCCQSSLLGGQQPRVPSGVRSSLASMLVPCW